MLVLGALCGLSIAVTASVNVGHPLKAARAEAEHEAASRATAVELAWERIALRDAPPGQPLGVHLRPAEDVPRSKIAVWEPTPETPTPGPRSNMAFDLLLDSALRARRPDQFSDALELVEEALAKNPRAPRAAEARLAAIRLASAVDDLDTVERHRRALLAPDGPTGVVEGSRIALLGCLVDPVDVESASGLLKAGALPPPDDLIVAREGALEFRSDPWWRVIEEALREADPHVDVKTLLQHDARIAHALARFASSPKFEFADGAWSLIDQNGATLAVRRDGDWVHVLAVDRSSVADAIESELEGTLAPPWDLAFGVRPGSARGESLLGPEELAGTGLIYSVTHEDPEVRGRAELARSRVLRGGLYGLGVLVLATAVLAARALARARRLAELRSTFVASVSHDLRTPTQAILLLAETLEQDRLAPPTPENRARYHVRIRKEAERLRRLVEDLLDSARIDRGEGARIVRRDVDLGVFFDDLEQAMEERAEAEGAELSIVRGALPVTASIDPDGVRRAIWNLFENALAHGVLEGESMRVHVSVALEGERLTVTVHDNGPGVPARLREAAFTPFERLRDRRASSDDISSDTGTGLGLAIVRSLSRAHGGDAAFLDSARGARVSASFALRETPDEVSAA